MKSINYNIIHAEKYYQYLQCYNSYALSSFHFDIANTRISDLNGQRFGEFKNVALDKTVKMSSQFQNGPGSLMVNGVRYTTYPCAHIQRENDPYL